MLNTKYMSIILESKNMKRAQELESKNMKRAQELESINIKRTQELESKNIKRAQELESKETPWDKLVGSCEWTKLYGDLSSLTDTIDKGDPVIVTDTDHVKYKLLLCLGHGFEGEVWKVRKIKGEKDNWEVYGPVYALKFEIGDVDIGKQLKQEYDILHALDHPYIMKPIKYWFSSVLGPDMKSPRGHMLSPYISGPTIDKATLSVSESRQVMMDLITAIKYLNVDVKIALADIKPDNIIIHQSVDILHPILIDAGFSIPIERDPFKDIKSLGLIYLLLISHDSSIMYEFRNSLDLSEKKDINAIISPIFILSEKQLQILTAFFDGTDHDHLLELVSRNFV
jgi:serine/threonine protein kinase